MEEFNKFQLCEYEHIANAHFETTKQVSQFFRYYLIIISAPALLLTVFFSSNFSLLDLYNQVKNQEQSIYNVTLGTIFSILALTGFTLCCYIISLRHDAVLYARTVNGIRKYFYETVKLFPIIENGIRTLAKFNQRPNYYEKHLFMPVIGTFALINSTYLGFALWLYFLTINQIIIYSSIFFFSHFFAYRYLAYFRDNYYIRSHKIGIDIDGVLNNHRVHFCDLLRTVRNIELAPDSITRIPVHEIPGINVTDIDEKYVFNTPRYWIDMPPIQSDFEVIKKLSKYLGYKIYIFSRRGWPEFSKMAIEDLGDYKKKWVKRKLFRLEIKLKIKEITKNWLKKHQIYYNRLIIEKGNLDVSDTTFWLFKRHIQITKNRFQYAHKYNFRYFVEDDYNNALKLANLCDFVFLVKQPYNQHYELPSNVILVNSWSEIYNFIRKQS